MSCNRSLGRFLACVAAIACLISFALPANAGTIFQYDFEGPYLLSGSGDKMYTFDTTGDGTATSGDYGYVWNVDETSDFLYSIPATGAGSTFDDVLTDNTKAVEFNVSKGIYSQLRNTQDVGETTSFTLEALVNLDQHNGSSTSYIFSRWFSNENSRVWALYTAANTGEVNFLACSDGTSATDQAFTSGIALTLDHDYYVGVTFGLATAAGSNDGTIAFYVQDLTAGTAMQTASFTHGYTSLYNGDNFCYVGGTEHHVGYADPKWNGLIDEIRMSDTVLAPSEFLLATAVPEPSTLALLLSAGVLLLWRRRCC